MTTAQAATSSDSSMEDILASIREILSDETAKIGGSSAPSAAASSVTMADTMPTPAVAAAPVPEPAPVYAAASSAPVAASGFAQAAPSVIDLIPTMLVSKGDDSMDPIMNPKNFNATVDIFSNLAKSLQERQSKVGNGEMTIEDVVKDIVKPLVKDWLDANLPKMVETIVKHEIEKAAARATL